MLAYRDLRKFGINIEEVFGQTITDLINRNLLENKCGYISLTERGKVIGNEVFEAFYSTYKNLIF